MEWSAVGERALSWCRAQLLRQAMRSIDNTSSTIIIIECERWEIAHTIFLRSRIAFIGKVHTIHPDSSRRTTQKYTYVLANHEWQPLDSATPSTNCMQTSDGVCVLVGRPSSSVNSQFRWSEGHRIKWLQRLLHEWAHTHTQHWSDTYTMSAFFPSFYDYRFHLAHVSFKVQRRFCCIVHVATNGWCPWTSANHPIELRCIRFRCIYRAFGTDGKRIMKWLRLLQKQKH